MPSNPIANLIIKQQMGQQQADQGLNQFAQQLQFLQDQMKNIPAGSGLMAKPRGFYEMLKNEMGMNPELDNYLGLRNLLGSRVARSMGGEKGAMSDRDVERVFSAIPNEYTSAEARPKKFEALKQLLQLMMSNPPQDPNNPYPAALEFLRAQKGQ